MWYITATCMTIFQCSPVRAYWDMMDLPPFCHSAATYMLGTELTNLFLDILILFLPIGMIRKLQLPLVRKISVASIFLLGGL